MCAYISVATAQPALNYLPGAPAGSSPRQRTEAPAAVHASSLNPCKPCLLLRLNLVCHKSMAMMCALTQELRSTLQLPGANAAVEDEQVLSAS